MSIAIQTFAASAANWGSAYRTSGPSYSKLLASGGNPARSSFSGGTDTWRSIWELDMAVLVAGGYTPGRNIIAMTLALTFSSNTGVSVKTGIFNNTLADSAQTVFLAVDAANCQDSAQSVTGTGAKIITFGAATIAIVRALAATDKRIIAMPIADEVGVGGQIIADSTSTGTLTLTMDDQPNIGGSRMGQSPITEGPLSVGTLEMPRWRR